MISVRSILLVVGIAAVGVAVAVFVSRPSEDPSDVSSGASSGVARTGLGAREPAPPTPPVGGEPREVLDPMEAAQRLPGGESILRRLSSRLVAVRTDGLRELVERGMDGESAAVRARAAVLEASEDPTEALWAKGALARLDGDRRRLVEIARRSVSTPEWEDPKRIVRALDPSSAEAILRAIELASRPGPDGKPVSAASEFVEAWTTGRDAASAVLARGIASAERGTELETWLNLAGGFRPTPIGVVESLVERSKGGDREWTRETFLFLGGSEVEQLPALSPDVSRFLTERLAAGIDGGRPEDANLLLFGVVGKLPALDAETARALTAWLRVGKRDVVGTVLATVAGMGSRGAAAIPGILEWVEDAPAEMRVAAVPALAASGRNDVAAYAAKRLTEAPADEQRAWLQRLRAVPGAAPLWEPLQRLADGDDEDVAALAVAAAARVDPAAGAESRRLLLESAGDRRTKVRIAAVSALGGLNSVPSDLWGAVVDGLQDRDEAVQRAAAQTAATAAERTASGVDIVTPLLPLLRDPASPLEPGARVTALHALAARAPSDPRVRGALLDAVERPGATLEERQAALWGLGRTANPAPDEREVVRRAGESDVRLKDLADRILSQEGWRTP